jgi:gliding motility-associated-like protein
MKKYLIKLFIITPFFIGAQVQLDRQVVGSAGKNMSNSSLDVNFTVGETFTETMVGEKAHTLGFQQPEFKETIIENLIIPGGLSPNNDNLNDTWTIQGLLNYPNAKVSVFNRWGQAVYEGDVGSAPWDGTSKGSALPIADYYYMIDLGNGEKYNGVVTLKR